MEERYTPAISEEERAARRAQRAKARQQKLRARRKRQMMTLVPAAVLAVSLVGLLTAWAAHREPAAEPEPAQIEVSVPMAAPEPEPAAPAFAPQATSATVQLGEDFPSGYAVVIDGASGDILAAKNPDVRISPASMTKILTLLVAAEHVEDLDDTAAVTIEVTDYCYVNDCSVVGLEVGETVSIRELLYGTILSSGADAALTLANYVAGSHEAFVELMNEKLEELGISGTAHFTNCVGLYDADHTCTVTDMAVILKAAMDNPLCREVLTAHTYETAPTPEHPDGQILSNWFLRKIEDHDQDSAVRAVAAKTGFVVQSGNCAASYGENTQGDGYLCVTANAYSGWRAIYDHVELYKTYCR